MKNFTLDTYLSQKLRKLSDKFDKAEVELLEEMFSLYEANLDLEKAKEHVNKFPYKPRNVHS